MDFWLKLILVFIPSTASIVFNLCLSLIFTLCPGAYRSILDPSAAKAGLFWKKNCDRKAAIKFS